MRTTTRWKRSAGALAAILFTWDAYGAHPLNTEDTGTQGTGRSQLEVNGEKNSDVVQGEKIRGAQAAAVLSYGFAETADVQVGVPWLDNGTEKGVGDAFAALKWRFWQKEPWSLGLRAGVTFPTGDENRGLGNGQSTWAALLIGQYEGERWIFLSHIGYKHNRNDFGDREPLSEISGAVLFKATEGLKLLVDASRVRNPDPNADAALRQLVVGAIYSYGKDLDFDAGVRFGNDPAIDRAFMAGITVRW